MQHSRITGNVIKQSNNPAGKYQVYTKAEMDNMFKSLNQASCLQLLGIMKSSWQSSCLDKEYNRRADIDDDGKVGNIAVAVGVCRVDRNIVRAVPEHGRVERDIENVGRDVREDPRAAAGVVS